MNIFAKFYSVVKLTRKLSITPFLLSENLVILSVAAMSVTRRYRVHVNCITVHLCMIEADIWRLLPRLIACFDVNLEQLTSWMFCVWLLLQC